MRLDLCSWYEVETYLAEHTGIFLPVGSTEQHGPMGLIGTDALCSGAIAERAADMAGSLVAPPIAYTPAPFNMGFPGTVSVSEPVFAQMFQEILASLQNHGFSRIFVVNGHGANLAPMHRVAQNFAAGSVRIRNWWDPGPVNEIRQELYGDWEGLHATPSEIAITQALYRVLPPGEAAEVPRKLIPAEIAERAGDRHGSPDRHRREFPDGRVGSHSALARPDHGERLLLAAADALSQEFRLFASETR